MTADIELEERNSHHVSGTTSSHNPSAPENSSTTVESSRTVVHKMRLDPNAYATKKTIAQGMLDIALLTANASQLKYVLQVGTGHEFYYPLVTMISISITLQIIIGLGFLMLGTLNINNSEHQKKANRMNNIITAGVFTVTVLNVLVSAFGMKQSEDDTKFNYQRKEPM